MEYEKYIVPIYTSEESKTTPDEDDFNGNGIIIGDYLITAGHVILSDKTTRKYFPNVWFEFAGNFYKLTQSIYFEYTENTEIIGNNTTRTFDLAVYSIKEITNSTIEFVNEQDDYMSCYYYGYSMNDDEKQLFFDKVDTIKIYTKVVDNRNCRPPYYIDNCFEFCPNKILKHGNSGGAMFQGNKFVGLFVSIPMDENNKPLNYRSRCISAHYINNIIKQLHLCHS